jgi:predicted nucleic acid-binding protein
LYLKKLSTREYREGKKKKTRKENMNGSMKKYGANLSMLNVRFIIHLQQNYQQKEDTGQTGILFI